MNMKKLAISALTAAMLVGCSATSSGTTSTSAKTTDERGRALPAESGSKDIDTLKFAFVPSRPADEIITATSGLGDLVIESMKAKGYNIGKVDISVSDSYEAAGEALSAGTVDVAWLPGGTYALFSKDNENETQVILTATRNGLSNDSENPAEWNGEAHKTLKNGGPVTYYKGLIYAGPSEYGKKLAEKVNKGEKLTWEDLNGAKWAVRDVTSSSGYIYPTMWLMDNFDGKRISDLANVTTLDYASEFLQAAAEQIDVIVCYADGRNDYEKQWQAEWGRKDSIWNELNVIGVTQNIYNDTVSVTMSNPDIYNKEFMAALQDSLIEIAGTDAGKKIISIYSHSGYEKAQDKDYDGARQALTVVE